MEPAFNLQALGVVPFTESVLHIDNGLLEGKCFEPKHGYLIFRGGASNSHEGAWGNTCAFVMPGGGNLNARMVRTVSS